MAWAVGLAGHRHRTDLRICIDLLIVIIDYFWLVCMIRDDDEKNNCDESLKIGEISVFYIRGSGPGSGIGEVKLR